MPSNTAPSIPAGLSAVFISRLAAAPTKRLGNALAAVTREIPDDFSSTHRVADERGLLEVQFADHDGEIIRKSIEIVAGRRLARAAKSPAIVGDDPIARG
jgi:hypothetical protein